MNEEEELKKGCRKYIGYVIKLGFKIDYKCGDLIWDEVKGIKEIKYCPTCQARLEGFQKGKLEQKKEDIKIIDKTLIKLANVLHPSNQDYDWYKIIYTELKKEILGEEKVK